MVSEFCQCSPASARIGDATKQRDRAWGIWEEQSLARFFSGRRFTVVARWCMPTKQCMSVKNARKKLTVANIKQEKLCEAKNSSGRNNENRYFGLVFWWRTILSILVANLWNVAALDFEVFFYRGALATNVGHRLCLLPTLPVCRHFSSIRPGLADSLFRSLLCKPHIPLFFFILPFHPLVCLSARQTVARQINFVAHTNADAQQWKNHFAPTIQPFDAIHG